MNAALASVLAKYPLPFQPLSPPEPLGNAGGLSGSKLWRFRTGQGLFVARSWPVGVSVERIHQIHRWIAKAQRLGFVPIPVLAMDGKTVREVGGICWDVCPWMPGAADLSASPSLAKVKVAFSGLAAFHQAMGPLREEPFCPGLAARSRELKTLLSGELHSWRRAVLHHQADPAQQLALRWLNLAELIAPRLEPEMAHLASLPTPVQPVIRDVRPEHLLFTDDRLTGLVDFGAMEIDTVSADLARLLSEWLGSDRFLRAEALTAYVRVRCLDSVELRLIDAFERSAALLGGGRWVQWHFVERIPFEDTSAVQRGLERGVERIERLITR